METIFRVHIEFLTTRHNVKIINSETNKKLYKKNRKTMFCFQKILYLQNDYVTCARPRITRLYETFNFKIMR